MSKYILMNGERADAFEEITKVLRRFSKYGATAAEISDRLPQLDYMKIQGMLVYRLKKGQLSRSGYRGHYRYKIAVPKQ